MVMRRVLAHATVLQIVSCVRSRGRSRGCSGHATLEQGRRVLGKISG